MGFDLGWLDTLPVTTISLKRPRGVKGVVVLNSKVPVVQALNTLVENEILSAPVWDDEKKDFVANLDMRDIVNLVAKTIKQHDDLEPKKLLHILGNDDMFKRPIKDAFPFSPHFAFFAVKENATLGQVLRQMVETGDKDHRRVLVFGEGSIHDPANLKSIVSQSAIISLIAQKKNQLGPGVNLTVADAWGTNWEESRSRVVSISSSNNTVEAFALMQEQNVSGLAVLDDHGRLLGTIGTRDVKGLVAQGPLDLTKLRLTTREYINFIKQLSVEEKHPAISIRKVDTVGTLLGKFSSTHVHRIFVIDENSMPIGVISTIDLLTVLSGKKAP